MTSHRQTFIGTLSALAILAAPLGACAASSAVPTETPAAPAPASTSSTDQVIVLAAPEPQIVIAQLDDDAVAERPRATPSAAGAAPESDAAADAKPVSAATETDDVANARRTLQAYLDQTTSLRADFRSILLDERKVPVAESSGVVMVKRPHRFRWEYREPGPSLILADGERLWSYDPELEQAVVRKLADLEGANPSNLLGGDTRIDEDFEVLGSYRSDAVEWVELRPRGSSDFTRVRLGFAADKIELMELHDQLGQVTQIALSSLETNPDLAESLFQFEPPPGTDVVGAD